MTGEGLSREKPLILVVDDREEDAYLLTQIFRGHGFDVDSAGDGVSAMERAATCRPDLVVSDVFMPRMDGFALCRSLRQNESTRSIPFIFYSANYTSAEDESFARRIGADLFLTKPQEPDILISVVKGLLTKGHPQPPEPVAPVDDAFQSGYATVISRKLGQKLAELEAMNETLLASQMELRRHKQRQEALLAAIPDIVVELDSTLVCTWANPAALDFFGADIVGQRFDELTRPPAETRTMLDALFLGRQDTASIESWQRRKDGELRQLSWSCRSLREPGNPVRAILGTARDRTERARTDQALLESEQRFSTFFNLSPVGIVICRLSDGHIVDFNEACAGMLGESKSNLSGSNQTDLDQWLGSDAREMLLRQLRENRQVQDLNLALHRMDGSTLDVSLSAKTIELQEKTHAVIAISDVSLQNQARRLLEAHREELETRVAERTEELRQQTRALHAVIDNIPHLVWMKDVNGRFVALNRAIADAIGLPFAALIGKTDFDIWDSETASRYRAIDEDVMAFRQRKTIVEPLGGFPDSLFETSKTPVLDEDGTVLGTVGFSRDISAQRALEEERERAREEAERLARTKGEFLANMSHEIRTPLHAILGMARSGFQHSQDDRARAAFGHILDSGRLLLSVVNDVLDFSKIEAGRLRIEYECVNISSIIADAMALMQEPATTRGITLSARSEGLPSLCRSDPVRLSQILLNLLSNAIKFTDAGSVQLTARATANELTFSVTDTGIGMSEEALQHIFRPFEQADGTTTRRFGGTGLGLAITRRIVEMMEGSLTVESSPGKGSSFTVLLPLIPSSPDDTQDAEMARQEQAGNRLEGLRILAAEDNEVNRLLIEELLREEGATVTLAENGRVAVEEAASGQFDVVLMDIQMPIMDGYEATRLILARHPDLPIIGQTAHAMAEERDRCLAAGMVDHVPKPLDDNQLVRSISRAVGRRDTSHGKSAAELHTRPLLNRAALQERFGNKPDFINRLLTTILANQTPMIARLHEAARNENLIEMADLCHAIKGASGNIMATAVFQEARAAEDACRAGDTDALRRGTALANLLEELMVEIEDWQKASRKA